MYQDLDPIAASGDQRNHAPFTVVAVNSRIIQIDMNAADTCSRDSELPVFPYTFVIDYNKSRALIITGTDNPTAGKIAKIQIATATAKSSCTTEAKKKSKTSQEPKPKAQMQPIKILESPE